MGKENRPIENRFTSIDSRSRATGAPTRSRIAYSRFCTAAARRQYGESLEIINIISVRTVVRRLFHLQGNHMR